MQSEAITQTHVLPPGVEVSFGVLTTPHGKTQIVVNANGSKLANGTLWRLYSWTGAGAALIHECELSDARLSSMRLAFNIEDGAQIELRGYNPNRYATLAISASLIGYDPGCCDAIEVLPEVDYVIVGLGTAGCALARFLSEDMTTSVLVLEAGANFATDPLVLGSGNDPAFLSDPKYHFHRQVDARSAQTSPDFGATPYLYTEGRMWGGSSGHNFHLAVRGAPSVYNGWGAVDAQWSYSNLLPLMLYMESFFNFGDYVPNAAQRGLTGPLSILQFPPAYDPTQAFLAALGSAANVATVADYCDPTSPPLAGSVPANGECVTSEAQVYIDPFTFSRSWSQSAFLPTSVVTPEGQGVGGRHLQILSHATAQKILFDTSGDTPRATGVLVQIQSSPPRFVLASAATKIILCTGALADPALLQRSGIGDSALLGALGIPVIVDNANIGQNLQSHYGPNIEIPVDTENPPPPPPLVFFSDLSGDNIDAPSGVRLNQSLVVPGTYSDPEAPVASAFNWMLRPTHAGTVAITSLDPNDDPLVTFKFYGPDAEGLIDRANAVKALKMWANISLAYTGSMPNRPAAALYPAAEYGADGGAAADDSELLAYALQNNTITNHMAGSCKMAADVAGGGVVDGNLDVLGVDGLAVCSNAIMPQITSGNTAYPAYLIGLLKAKIEGGLTPY